jgi:hypothetical protein
MNLVPVGNHINKVLFLFYQRANDLVRNKIHPTSIISGYRVSSLFLLSTALHFDYYFSGKNATLIFCNFSFHILPARYARSLQVC